MTRSNLSRVSLQPHGFTLFEFVVVILLIGLMMTFAIDRMLRLQIDAERVSIEQISGTLRSAVNLQAAELVVKQGLGSLAALENTNPMNYLSELPANYIGEITDADAGSQPPGSWYFDRAQKVLVYTVRNADYFETGLAGVPRVRLKVSLVYRGKANAGHKSDIRGVTVSVLDRYNWKPY